MISTLLQSPYFALFVIVALGYILGRINIKGISLDVSAVIFIALLFGHYGVVIPRSLSDFGMVLFIFTIGMQAGPGFFDSFRSKGTKIIGLAFIIIGTAAVVTIATKYIFGFDVAQSVGILTGALTSTPGLATARELTGDQTAVAYGIAYPFGVIGVILFIKLLPKILKVKVKDVEKEIESNRVDKYPLISTRIFKVTNPIVFGKNLNELQVRTMTGAVISRIKHGDTYSLPASTSILYSDDVIKAVGTNESLDKMTMFLGEQMDGDLPLGDSLDLQTGVVTNKSLVNRSLLSLNIQKNFNCTITRVRRSGIDLPPTPNLQLKFGDKLTIVGDKNDLQELQKLLGNDIKRLSDTDFLPVALGIIIGVLFGKFSISFGQGFTFSFGLTGGILLVALVLSAIGKTGPLVWHISASANQLLRQLGLLLFLAGVGTSAGATVVETFMTQGWGMFVAGVLVTLTPMIVAAFVAHYVFKMNILDIMGALTGGMTSTPGLAAADSMTTNSAPSIAYATIYPAAMVFLILAVQLVVGLFS